MREREGEGEIKIDPKEWVRLRGIQRRKWERKSGGGHERMWQEERLKGWGVGTWREETSQRKSRSLCKQWILWRGRKWEHGLEGKEDVWAGGRRRSMQGLGGGRWSAGRVEQEETTHTHTRTHKHAHTLEIWFNMSRLKKHTSERERNKGSISRNKTVRYREHVRWN